MTVTTPTPTPTQAFNEPALLSSALSLLPPTTPTLRTPLQALALLLHSIHLSANLVPSQPLTAETFERDDVESFKFKYLTTANGDGDGEKFEMSGVELGGRVIVAAAVVGGGEGGSRTEFATLDLLPSTYFNASFFPFSLPSSSSRLLNIFTSPEELTSLLNLYRTRILSPLLPAQFPLPVDVQVEGTGSGSGSGLASAGAPPSQSQRHPTSPVYPAGESSPLELRSRAHAQEPHSDLPLPGLPLRDHLFPSASSSSTPHPNPFSIGSSDLDPLGGRSGTTFPGFPGSRGPVIPGAPGGDGMIVGPGHPIFGGRFGNGEGMGGGEADLRVPPGARYDPIGPFDPNAPPPFGPGPGRGRGAPGGRRNFGDEFPPPGFNNSGNMFG